MILSPDLQNIEEYVKSSAERRIARVLAKIQRSDAVAFHSMQLRSHPSKQTSEGDFIVLWKGAVVIVEVKGGGVMKHEGVWYSKDRHGDWNKLKEPPMTQARTAMHALLNILREDGLGWVLADAIVITPDIDAPPTSPEWQPTHWLAKDAMTVERFASSLDAVVASIPAAPKTARAARFEELREKLFGEFSRIPVIDAQRGAVIDEQNVATEDQARVLAGLIKNARIMVLGGAGTGKSVVLAEAAKQEAAAGRSVLVTFRSPGLRAFFAPRLDGRPIEIAEFAALDDARRFDVVLVDEAQDLMYAGAMDVLDRVIIGGRSRGRWRMFLDQNNQAHVDGRFDADVFELVKSDAAEYDLSKNVRNTRAIVHMVQEYLAADVGDPGIVNGEPINWEKVGEGDSRAHAMRLAKSFKRDGVRASDVWIIPADCEATLDEIVDGIRVVSPRNAKGLEADHVIVCNLPEDYTAAALSNLYVAVTRARVTLHIAVIDADRRRLQRLVRKASGARS
ncbi:NERD domain-containing protein [Microbacterium sp. As-52]|uniref:nuclease-related domain-containing DEAD/DEAH box helicase n=1 Tax=Microbacterium sp. As-52 TaxID=3390503 RepID=UPI003CF02C17